MKGTYTLDFPTSASESSPPGKHKTLTAISEESSPKKGKNPAEMTQEKAEGGKVENQNERLIIFSDGIIAFALTISAVAIKISANADELNKHTGAIFTQCLLYTIGFIMIAFSWTEHHRIFHYIKRNDLVFITLNLVYLGSVVVLPIGLNLVLVNFSINLSSTGNDNSLYLFLSAQFIAGVALLAMWLYASHEGRLLGIQLDKRYIRYTRWRLFSQPLILLIFWSCLILLQPLVALVITTTCLLLRFTLLSMYRRNLDTYRGSVDLGRIQLFSDAIISISITILAAQIDFPSSADPIDKIMNSFDESWPRLHAFIIGCFVMAAFWLFHYHLFRFIKRQDPFLIILNFAFLLCIALMFIPVNLYVDYWNNAASISDIFFGAWQTMTALMLVCIWLYAKYKNRFLHQHVTDKEVRKFSIAVVSNPVIFALLTVAAYFFPMIKPATYLELYFASLACVLLAAHLLTRNTAPTGTMTTPKPA